MATQLTVERTLFPPYPASIAATAPRAASFALVRTSLLVVLLAAPVAIGAVQPWAWGALSLSTFLLFFAWSIASARQSSVKIRWSPLYVPAGFIFLLGIIQFTGRLTMDRIATREALLKLSTDIILFFVAAQLFSGQSSRRLSDIRNPRHEVARHQRAQPSFLSSPAFRWTLVVYTFLLSLFAIFQFFSSEGLIYGFVRSPGWTFGPYVNHNHYAGLMEMLIPLSVAAALPALRRQSSAAVVGSLILIPIASLLLSASRGGFIALLVEVAVAGALIFWCGPRHARRLMALAGSAALVAAALLFFWMAPRNLAERLERMVDGSHPPEVELSNRMVAARDALVIWRDHPWLGAGLGSFETAFPRHQSFASDFLWDHAHNDYAEALAETGVAGAAAIVSALALFLWLAFRNLRERLRHTAGWMQFAAALGCCGLLAHSFADFNLHIPANAAWFAVCGAIATSRGSGE